MAIVKAEWIRANLKKIKVDLQQQEPGLDIFNELGDGGFGVVYEGELNGIAYALKFYACIDDAGNFSPDQYAVAKNEANLLGMMNHPQVMKGAQGKKGVLTYSLLGKKVFCIVLVLIEGDTLGQIISREGFIDQIDALRICARVAQILAEGVHIVGIVHRDIKPDNVFIANGQVILGDFSISKRIGKKTLTAVQNFGTAGYHIPSEEGREHLQDLFALVALLYAMLIGRDPDNVLDYSMGEPMLLPPSRVNLKTPIDWRIDQFVLTGMNPWPELRDFWFAQEIWEFADNLANTLTQELAGKVMPPLPPRKPTVQQPVFPQHPRACGYCGAVEDISVLVCSYCHQPVDPDTATKIQLPIQQPGQVQQAPKVRQAPHPNQPMAVPPKAAPPRIHPAQVPTTPGSYGMSWWRRWLPPDFFRLMFLAHLDHGSDYGVESPRPFPFRVYLLYGAVVCLLILAIPTFTTAAWDPMGKHPEWIFWRFLSLLLIVAVGWIAWKWSQSKRPYTIWHDGLISISRKKRNLSIGILWLIVAGAGVASVMLGSLPGELIYSGAMLLATFGFWLKTGLKRVILFVPFDLALFAGLWWLMYHFSSYGVGMAAFEIILWIEIATWTTIRLLIWS